MSGMGAQLSVTDRLREHEDSIPQRRIDYPHGLSIELSPIESVPIRSILPGDSPRLAGEDHAHAQVLANTEDRLPPIVVHRQSMRVIDGSHRCLAALLRGEETIEVRFFEGPEELLFLIAVRENITHGLPLSQADREAAAVRVLAAQPRWSDRAIAAVTGIAAKRVGALRKVTLGCATDDAPQLNTRVGRDGRVRPVDYAQGRLRAGEVVTAHPEMPLREVARKAGVSVATARDVRQRIQRGADPLPPRLRLVEAEAGTDEEGGPGREAACETVEQLAATRARPVAAVSADWSMVRPKLLRDPLLKYSESGRALFRWYDTHAMDTKDLVVSIEGVPPHWVNEIMAVARSCGELWLRIAQELEKQRQEA